MDTQTILTKVQELVRPVFENLGYDLIEQEFQNEGGRWILRLYIDKEGGVNVGDCERASRSIEDLIEVEGVIPVPYGLEVSSPGVNRPLRRRGDFERYRGTVVRLKTLHPVGGRTNYKGVLEGIQGDEIVMVVDGVRHRIPFFLLGKARLEPENL